MGIEHGIRLGSIAPRELEGSGRFKDLLGRFGWVYLGPEFCENLLEPGLCREALGFLEKGKKVCLLTPVLSEKGLAQLKGIFKELLKLARAGRFPAENLEITVNDLGAAELAARLKLPFRLALGRQLYGNAFKKSKGAITAMSYLGLEFFAARGVSRFEFSATGRMPSTNFTRKPHDFAGNPFQLTLYYPYLNITTTRTCLVGMPDIAPHESVRELRCGRECRACAFEVAHPWIKDKLLIRGNTVFMKFPDKFYTSEKELLARRIDRLVYTPFP